MATLNATPATVWAVVGSAAPGDVVQLAAGAYGALNLWNQAKAAPGVTIQPAPGAVPAISGINASGSTNLTFTGLEVQATPTTQYALEAGGSSNVTFDGLMVHQGDNATLVGVGCFIRNSQGVTVKGCEFHHFGCGVSLMDSTGCLVSGCHIHHVEIDGLDISGSSNVTVANNDFDHFYPGDGDHPDAIQCWGTLDHPRCDALTITDNRIVASGGGVFPPQGIFLGNASNVVVRGNALVGTLYNGISLADVQTALVEGNFVQSAPWADANGSTRIIVRGASSNVTVRNNLCTNVSQYLDGGAPNPNYLASNNTPIAATTRDAAGELNTTDFAKWVAAQGQTPAPAPAPAPTVNPLQATVDAQAAQITALKAQIAAAAKLAQTLQTAVTGVQKPLTALKTALQ